MAPDDPHGHGTAVAEAIMAVAPHADIEVIRVLDASNTGASSSIYQGLIVALWGPGGFHVVNASFGVDAKSHCGTSLASTFNYLMRLRRTKPNCPAPVAAAGNNRTVLRSPATAASATVVTATDFNGAPAPYCASLRIEPGIDAVSAPGGTDSDPLGSYRGGAVIYGTSFATGFVTGSLVRE